RGTGMAALRPGLAYERRRTGGGEDPAKGGIRMTWKIYICNAFSLSMLDREEQSRAKGVGAPWGDSTAPHPRIPGPVDDPRAWLEQRAGREWEIVSAVGHADTARIFSGILGREVEPN